MGPTWPNISPRWLNMGPTWPNMGTTCAQHGPRLLPYRQALRIMPASVQHSPPWVCAENLGPIFPHHTPKVVARAAPVYLPYPNQLLTKQRRRWGRSRVSQHATAWWGLNILGSSIFHWKNISTKGISMGFHWFLTGFSSGISLI